MADLVLWSPAFFGAKPEIVIKGGYIAWAQMGQFNLPKLHVSIIIKYIMYYFKKCHSSCKLV